MSLLLLIIGFLLIVSLVVVHEWGHFIMARRSGVKVKEFSIFMGPKLYQRKTKAGYKLSLRLLPIGGYVSLKGENDLDNRPGTFGASSLKTKTKILLAGVGMNFIVAIFLFTVIAWVSMPVIIPNQYTVKSDTKVLSTRTLITSIEAGSPAKRAGLKSYDQISAIGLPGHAPEYINAGNNLPTITKNFAGKTVDVYIQRGASKIVKKVTLLSSNVVSASQKTNNPKGYLGVIIYPSTFEFRRSTWSAPIVALGLSYQITKLSFIGLGHFFGGIGSTVSGAVTSNKVARQNGQAQASNLGGPVVIYIMLKISSIVGIVFMLFIVAYISLALAIMNLLPVPALDGGRLYMILFSRIFKRRLSPKKEQLIVGTSFALLFILMIIITISNVQNYL